MKKRTNNHWTEAKDRLIIDLIERGETPMKHPALLAEHSADAISVRCSMLRKQGLAGRLPRVRKQYAWAEDEHRLIELVEKRPAAARGPRTIVAPLRVGYQQALLDTPQSRPNRRDSEGKKGLDRGGKRARKAAALKRTTTSP